MRKGNLSVAKFHERFGAVKTGETADDFVFNISRAAIEQSLDKYKKYLPDGISVEQ